MLAPTWLVALALALVVCEPATLAATAAASEFAIRAWQTQDGLPENSATSMVQTPDGYLWFGTFNGLVRFNGSDFQVYDRVNTPGWNDSAIINLFLDSRGWLWISTGDGLACRQNGQWKRFPENRGWTGTFARCFAESRDGQLVVTSDDGLIFSLAGDRFLEMASPPGEGRAFFVAHFDPDGSLWVANPRFFGCWKGGRWEQALPASHFHGFTGAASSRDGGMWILDEEYLRKYRSGREVFQVRVQQRAVNCWAMFEDRHTNVWASSVTDGVYRIAPSGQVTHLTVENGLSYGATRFVFEDREANYWVGTSGGGLLRLTERKFQNYGLASGIPDRLVKSVMEGANGRVVVGTFGGGLAQIENARAVRWPGSAPTAGRVYVTTTALDRRGRLWVGTYGAGLRILDGEREEQVPTGMTGGEIIFALFLDSKGTMWLGTQRGIVSWDGQAYTTYGAAEGVTAKHIGCFAEDPRHGTLWAGAVESGLFRLREGPVKRFSRAEGLVGAQVTALRCEDDGTLWIGTADTGLARYRDGRFTRIGPSEGMPARGIGCILDDRLGHFWLGSSRGILRLDSQTLRAVADGTKARMDYQLYGVSDGLEGEECASGYQTTGMRGSDGRLWFATIQGLAVVNPSQVGFNPLPPPVRIEQVVYHRRTAWGTTAADRPQAGSRDQSERIPGPFDKPISLPAGTRRIEIHYAALSFTAPEKVRYQTMLAEHDAEWSDAGGQRVAYFNELPPGQHRFRVRAANNDGVWNESGAVLAFNVLPHFWQRWWFKGLALATVFTVVGGAIRFVERQQFQQKLHLLERQRAVETERTRIAQDLHDDLGASLTEVVLLGELAKQEPLSTPEVKRQMQTLTDKARDVVRLMDEIVWAVNPQNDSLSNLASYLCQFAQEFLRSTPVRGRFDMMDGLPALPVSAQARHNVFLTVKEALHNVIKHAEASEVWLRIRHENCCLSISIEDNGRGFELDQVPATRCGLPNMRKRLEKVAGRMNIQSRRGTGTVVSLELPVGPPQDPPASKSLI